VCESRREKEDLIEERHDSRRVGLLDEVDAFLVVLEGDLGPVDGLLVVLLLLQLEEVVVELHLQLLVRVVDAELLERVDLWKRERQNTNESERKCGLLP
jgi:hypothetical protein